MIDNALNIVWNSPYHDLIVFGAYFVFLFIVLVGVLCLPIKNYPTVRR